MFPLQKGKYICVYMNFNGVGGTEAYETIMAKWSELEAAIPGLERSISQRAILKFSSIFSGHY